MDHMEGRAASIQGEIFQMDAKFQRACTQVTILNNFLAELQARYDRAVEGNIKTYRYTLKLRICSVEGIRNMYYEYATATAEQIEDLENQMRAIGVELEIIYPNAEVAEEESSGDSDGSDWD